MSAELMTGRSLPYRIAASRDVPRRLLILCHGVGGNETNLRPLAAMAPADTTVVLVRAPLTLGTDQFAWFPVTFGPLGPRPDLDAAEASRQRLVQFVAEMQFDSDVAPGATVLAGFSQGGIISASVALTRPDLVAGFGVLAGRILPELESQLAGGDTLGRIRAFIGHGRNDSKLPVDWAHRADAWLSALGVPHETRLYPSDHGIPQAMQNDFLAWFESIAG
jgi:phospholipase/carboxylesterase